MSSITPFLGGTNELTFSLKWICFSFSFIFSHTFDVKESSVSDDELQSLSRWDSSFLLEITRTSSSSYVTTCSSQEANNCFLDSWWNCGTSSSSPESSSDPFPSGGVRKRSAPSQLLFISRASSTSFTHMFSLILFALILLILFVLTLRLDSLTVTSFSSIFFFFVLFKSSPSSFGFCVLEHSPSVSSSSA